MHFSFFIFFLIFFMGHQKISAIESDDFEGSLNRFVDIAIQEEKKDFALCFSDNEEYGIQEEEEQSKDPYQSFTSFKKHLKNLFESGSYIRLSLNIAFCGLLVTTFVLPLCLVIYRIVMIPEKLFFDKIYSNASALVDGVDGIVKTESDLSNTFSYLLKNSTEITKLVFLASGEKLFKRSETEEYYNLKREIEYKIYPLIRTRSYTQALKKTKGIVTRFCFDVHGQNFDIETIDSKESLKDPLDLSFKKECLGKQVFLTQNMGSVYKSVDENYYSPVLYSVLVDVHDVYKSVYKGTYNNGQNTQIQLMQTGGDPGRDDYLVALQNDFLNKTDMQSLLTMVVDSLQSHQCPSHDLFDKLSISVRGLRSPLKYIGDKYLQIKLWYRDDGTVRHVIATSTNNITDRSNNHNETTPCNFASQAQIDGADARLDLDRFAYLRVISGRNDLSFTLPETITHALLKTYTDHFSKEQTISKTPTDEASNTDTKNPTPSNEMSYTPTKTPTPSKSISILSREQYFDLLAKGIWFNESDAYLNSIFPEIGGYVTSGGYGCSCETKIPINQDGTNSTTFNFLYSLPSRFIFQLFGSSYGPNSNTMTKIYLGNDMNTTDYFNIYTGNTPISPGWIFYYYNDTVIVNNTNNASFLRIMIPHPQRDPNGDPRYFGFSYIWMKIIALP